MKKNIHLSKIVACFLGLALLCSGCSAKEEAVEQKNIKSIADEGIDIVEVPKGCEIIKDTSLFTTLKESQTYVADTDCNNRIEDTAKMDNAGNEVYFFEMGCIYHMDNDTKKLTLLCGKPDCSHGSEICNAYVDCSHNADIDIYQEDIYIVDDNGNGSDASLDLVKISKDGTERETICTLVKVDDAQTGSVPAVTYFIHRGYIYYVYNMGAGYTEDSYYLNGSNCIYRKALDEKSEPECIMPLEVGMDQNYIRMKMTGSYVYFILPVLVGNNGLEGQLYRYNTESRKVEELSQVGSVCDYAIVDGDILFKKLENKHEIWKFEQESQEISLLFETDKDFGDCYISLYADKKYIYNVYHGEGELSVIYRAYDYDGNYVGSIDRGEYEYMGMDDEKLYFQKDKHLAVDISYVLKSELAEDKAEFHKLEE